MRKILIVLGIVVVVVVVAALALPSILDVNRYRPRIQAQLEQRLNRPVTLGPMTLKLVPLRIRAQYLEIGEDPQIAVGKPFARAEELNVAADLVPLLRGNVEIHSLELNRPRVELIRNAQGVWNFSSLGQMQSAQQTPSSPEQKQTQPSAQESAFTLGKLAISSIVGLIMALVWGFRNSLV